MSNTTELGDTLPARTVVMGEQESQNQLSVYDAYRFRAIVEEACERLEVLGLVTNDSARRKSDDSQGRNKKDVYHLMMNQKDLETRYEELMQRRSQLRGLSNKSKYLANQAELGELAKQLRDSTSTIYQNLKDQPTVAGNLHKIQKDRDELEKLLAATALDLKVGSFDTLVMEVNSRIEQQRSLSDKQSVYEKTRETLRNLEQSLREERENFTRSMEEKNVEIHELTQQLKHLKKVTALSLKYEKDTALAQRETIARMRKRNLDDIRDQISKTQEALARDSDVSGANLKYLGKQRNELKDLSDEWTAKYDQDFGKISEQLEELTTHRDKDNITLTKLQHRWKIDKAEKSATAMEMEQRVVETENKKKLLKIMNLAQAKITFIYRVYKKSKPKGKKKGKKSKKKK
jgi:peptidoglycan hydrolase CwlO-like protein